MLLFTPIAARTVVIEARWASVFEEEWKVCGESRAEMSQTMRMVCRTKASHSVPMNALLTVIGRKHRQPQQIDERR